METGSSQRMKGRNSKGKDHWSRFIKGKALIKKCGKITPLQTVCRLVIRIGEQMTYCFRFEMMNAVLVSNIIGDLIFIWLLNAAFIWTISIAFS